MDVSSAPRLSSGLSLSLTLVSGHCKVVIMHSRHLEVVGARKNRHTRGGHTRGEREPAWKAHKKIVSTHIL